MPATICVNCRHFHREPGGHRLWGAFCLAVKRMPAVDPVYGKPCFVGKNDLGGTYYTDEEFMPACQVNDGNCGFYEEKT